MSAPAVLSLSGGAPSQDELDPVVRHLAGGGTLAYPTETVYGFGGRCTPGGVERILALKGRGEDRPLLVLLPGPEAAASLRWTDEARELASIFWPGALTLVLADPDSTFPAGVRSRSGAVAVRVSPHPFVAALLGLTREPLTSTSANAPAEAPALTAGDARDAAVRLGAGAEMLVVDAGPLPPSGPSTLVDCSAGQPVVLREGTIPLTRLRCAIPHLHGH